MTEKTMVTYTISQHEQKQTVLLLIQEQLAYILLAIVLFYIKASSNNHGINVSVSLEGTDIIQVTNITFY